MHEPKTKKMTALDDAVDVGLIILLFVLTLYSW